MMDDFNQNLQFQPQFQFQQQTPQQMMMMVVVPESSSVSSPYPLLAMEPNIETLIEKQSQEIDRYVQQQVNFLNHFNVSGREISLKQRRLLFLIKTEQFAAEKHSAVLEAALGVHNAKPRVESRSGAQKEGRGVGDGREQDAAARGVSEETGTR